MKKNKLTGNGRYFETLPPKKEREEKRFNKWVDEAFDVFGWDKRIVKLWEKCLDC